MRELLEKNPAVWQFHLCFLVLLYDIQYVRLFSRESSSAVAWYDNVARNLKGQILPPRQIFSWLVTQLLSQNDYKTVHHLWAHTQVSTDTISKRISFLDFHWHG